MAPSLLKVFAGGSNKSQGNSNKTRITQAELDARPQAESSTSVNEEADSATAEERRQLKQTLQMQHDELSQEVCAALRAVVDSASEEWSVWDKTEHLLIDKKLSASGNFVGRGSYTWSPDEDYGMDTIEDFLWDQNTKSMYDEFTDAMLVILDYDGVDYHVVNQIFRSRFGISGRDFVLVIRKRREDDEQFERLIIGAQSIPFEQLPQIESLIVQEETAKQYYESGKKTVRGFAYIAGFVAERNRETKEYKITYVNDADVQSRGVPKWIVNRVKLDQLRIVEKIPGCIEEWLIRKRAECEAAVAESEDAGEDTGTIGG